MARRVATAAPHHTRHLTENVHLFQPLADRCKNRLQARQKLTNCPGPLATGHMRAAIASGNRRQTRQPHTSITALACPIFGQSGDQVLTAR